MKTIILLTMLLSGFAVAKGQTPKGELYWVVETNRNVADHSIVKIYDQDDQLVHETKVAVRLDIHKRKHRKALSNIVKQYSDRIAMNGKRNKSKSSV